MLRSCVRFRNFIFTSTPPSIFSSRCMATTFKDYVSHYDTLDVNPECTKTEIREAWLKLSMLYHPDLNEGNEVAAKKFMEVKEAYKILVNDEKRKEYNDQIGFHHSDPPPDYRREWTLQGEKTRNRARMYSVMWSEERIRDLMGSENLREVDWDKTPPAERYRLLIEEEEKQKNVDDILVKTGTPSWRVAQQRYYLIIAGVFALYCIICIAERDEWGIDVNMSPKPLKYEWTEGGAGITPSIQFDNRHFRTSEHDIPLKTVFSPTGFASAYHPNEKTPAEYVEAYKGRVSEYENM